MHQHIEGSGRLIVLEGNEAVGKTTLKETAVRFIESHGFEVVQTRSPGGSENAETIRSVIMRDGISPKTELLLFIAAIWQNYCDVILPALRDGKWVVCDRMFSSTIAYQIYGRGLVGEEMDVIRNILGNITPDLEIYITASPEKRAVNLATRGKENRLDAESRDFYSRVDTGYQNCFMGHSWTMEKTEVPNNGTLEEGEKLIRKELLDYMTRYELIKV